MKNFTTHFPIFCYKGLTVNFFWTLYHEGLIRMKNRLKDFAEVYSTSQNLDFQCTKFYLILTNIY